MSDRTQPLRVVVDRLEGSKAVLVADDEQGYEILAEELPKACRVEGAVLDVPLDAKRAPLWLRAHRNSAEEQRRRREAAEALKRLRRRDPGGDVQL